MTILNMSQSETDRLEVISRVGEKRLTLVQTGDILGLSKRQVQRLVNKYRQDGAAGLISKRREQQGNRCYPDSFREYVAALINTYYPAFGPTLVAEKFLERHDISL